MGNKDEAIIRKEILPYLSPVIKDHLQNLSGDIFAGLEEIRLRCGSPLLLKVGDRDYSISRTGVISTSFNNAYLVSEEDVYRTIASISDNSLYAFEEEIRRGFITVPGGHRVGLAGQVVLQGNTIRTMKDFSSICFRVAREVIDCAQPLLPHIVTAKNSILNTLIISPPRCGKTTVLRDIARIVSTGSRLVEAKNVVVVDERSEIAGCYRGIPQLNVGLRTDVLDSCPKAPGMIMAIRSLSPQVIITDEIGRKEDVEAIQECINTGVSIISSIHARNIDELRNRPVMRELLEKKSFHRGIILSRRLGPGTVEEIFRWD